MSLLRVTGLTKQKSNQFSLGPISFALPPFQKLALVGETGSGKSTLLKIIAGFEQPDGGTIHLYDERILGPDEKLLPGHPHIAYLSQHFELRNNYRVEELLDMVNLLPQAEADIIYDLCRITHLLKRWTHQLSGGEKQRIATARLLVTSPKLLLLDEPFSNLDAEHKRMLKDVLHNISATLGITCLLTSHDPQDVLSWADEILVIKEGNLIQTGSPQVVYHHPVNDYVAGLFGPYTVLSTAQAAALTLLLPENKERFIRPEYFSTSATDATETAAIINHTLFMGNYYLAHVTFADGPLLVQTSTANYKKGDTVYLSLLPFPSL